MVLTIKVRRDKKICLIRMRAVTTMIKTSIRFQPSAPRQDRLFLPKCAKKTLYRSKVKSLMTKCLLKV